MVFHEPKLPQLILAPGGLRVSTSTLEGEGLEFESHTRCVYRFTAADIEKLHEQKALNVRKEKFDGSRQTEGVLGSMRGKKSSKNRSYYSTDSVTTTRALPSNVISYTHYAMFFFTSKHCPSKAEVVGQTIQ